MRNERRSDTVKEVPCLFNFRCHRVMTIWVGERKEVTGVKLKPLCFKGEGKRNASW